MVNDRVNNVANHMVNLVMVTEPVEDHGPVANLIHPTIVSFMPAGKNLLVRIF